MCVSHYKVMKKAKIRNPQNQIPHLTQDTIWESDTRKHHIQESQEASPFAAGDHTAERKRQEKRIHKRSTALERSVRKLLKGFNLLDGTNLTRISDVDEDK